MIIENQKIDLKFKNGIELFIKREDLLHPIISGNKYRKLFYNLQEAKKQGKIGLLTFGGAFSNHIHATAGAGIVYNFKTIGIIRGDELAEKQDLNPTLLEAQKMGMELIFVSRNQYRERYNKEFLNELHLKFSEYYILPEGGTNTLAVKGCEEILTQNDTNFNYICCAAGTGGTIAGIINSSNELQKILGFPALKENFLEKEIQKYTLKNNFSLIRDYNFEGYGKVNDELIFFLNDFYLKTAIPLDPIYTGKMVFGIINLINKGFFPENSKILAIHTGGLQGIKGINNNQKHKYKINLIYDKASEKQN